MPASSSSTSGTRPGRWSEYSQTSPGYPHRQRRRVIIDNESRCGYRGRHRIVSGQFAVQLGAAATAASFAAPDVRPSALFSARSEWTPAICGKQPPFMPARRVSSTAWPMLLRQPPRSAAAKRSCSASGVQLHAQPLLIPLSIAWCSPLPTASPAAGSDHQASDTGAPPGLQRA